MIIGVCDKCGKEKECFTCKFLWRALDGEEWQDELIVFELCQDCADEFILNLPIRKEPNKRKICSRCKREL